MQIPVSKHRLRSSAFQRPDEDLKIEPKRLVVLSVEGDETERNYFEHLSEHLDHSLIQIEVLRHRRGDGYSAPQHVIELLSEYLRVRKGELVPDAMLEALLDKYTKETLDTYLNNSSALTRAQRKSIDDDLLLLGIDMDYRRYLSDLNTHPDDIFAIIIDRDCGNHDRDLMERCHQKCKDYGFGYYVTNPCFEFWLLLHLCDVKNHYSNDELAEILANPKISKNHTRVSKIVCDIAGHGKSIKSRQFNDWYYPNISKALTHSKDFASDYPEILDKLGTNLPELLLELGLSE